VTVGTPSWQKCGLVETTTSWCHSFDLDVDLCLIHVMHNTFRVTSVRPGMAPAMACTDLVHGTSRWPRIRKTVLIDSCCVSGKNSCRHVEFALVNRTNEKPVRAILRTFVYREVEQGIKCCSSLITEQLQQRTTSMTVTPKSHSPNSKILAVQSSEPVSTCFPSGLTAMACMPSLCPRLV